MSPFVEFALRLALSKIIRDVISPDSEEAPELFHFDKAEPVMVSVLKIASLELEELLGWMDRLLSARGYHCIDEKKTP